VDIHEGLESSLMIWQHRFYDRESDRPIIQVIKNYQQIPLNAMLEKLTKFLLIF